MTELASKGATAITESDSRLLTGAETDIVAANAGPGNDRDAAFARFLRLDVANGDAPGRYRRRCGQPRQ